MASLSPLERIQGQWPIIEEIRDKCGVGSISVGVLHQGEVLFTGSTSCRDIDQEKPDTHTLYTLCSISKSFVASALGILVDQGKCKWTDPVGPYLPEFKAKGDSRVATEATFNNFLRQSSGLANPMVTILGPEGKVLVPERDFINVLNETPTGREGFGSFFNATWEYSSVAYSLVALVIERLSGKRYTDFISEEILKPLGMNDTAVYKSQLASNDNLARSYVRLSDGSWYKQPEHEWTDELNTPVLAIIGIRSSINDLLIWCAATMDAHLGDAPNQLAALSGVSNPLKEIDSILDDYYWTRPSKDDIQNPCNYHLSWLKRRATRTHQQSHTGKRFAAADFVQNYWDGILRGRVYQPLSRYDERHRGHERWVEPWDPSDFTAPLLMQELFDLKGRVEIMPLVRREVEVRLGDWDRMVVDWKEHRDISQAEHPLEDYIGKYEGFGIVLDVRHRQGVGLEVVLNGREEITQALEHYNEDMYSYQPTNRDDWLRGAWLDWDYYMVGVLHFHRDESNSQVTSVAWTWERGCDPAILKKREP